MNEKILLVDTEDRPAGYCEKTETHRKTLLHRAFSVFLYSGNRMLIQRRAQNKYHSGGLWANSCCSHQRENETLNEAVHRRLREELGMDCHVTEIFSFIYRAEFDGEMTEYEYDHVFTGEYSGLFSPDPNETDCIEWTDIDELSEKLKSDPECFAVWFRIAAPEVIRYIHEKNS